MPYASEPWDHEEEKEVMTTLKERLDAAKARLTVANAALEVDADERQLRREIAQTEAAAVDAERERLWVDLEKRTEAAREAHPEGAFAPLMVRNFPDTFVIRRNSKAHTTWREKTIRAAAARAQNKKGADPLVIDREYAVDCVHDWNGRSDFDKNPELSTKLINFLTENSAIVTPITDIGGELAGVFAEERSKSD